MYKNILLALILIFPLKIFSQTFWKIETERGEEILMTFHIDTEKQTFIAHTRKNALKELAGQMAYLAARTAGLTKYPEIVHAEGKISVLSDTTFYNGNFYFGNQVNQFIAKSWQKKFTGTLIDDRNRKNRITGVQVNSISPIKDYPKITNTSFSLTEKYIYDRNLILSPEWKNFKSKIIQIVPKIPDDYEMAAVFYWNKRSLDDIPFEISKLQKNPRPLPNMVLPEEENPKTAYIDLNRLPDTPETMKRLFSEIIKKGYSNLVVEAGGRRLINMKSILYLCNHLSENQQNLGAFVTRKWTHSNPGVPNPDIFGKTFKNALDFQGSKFVLKDEPGCFLKTTPAVPVFKGKVYVLVTSRTQGVSEVFAIWAKNSKTASLAGQKTAGMPMLVEPVSIDANYFINLPVAWFYDMNGRNYLKTGVEPDIKFSKGNTKAQLSRILK